MAMVCMTLVTPRASRSLRRWGVAIAVAMAMAGCASLPAAVDRPVSKAMADTQSTPLALATEPQVRAHPGQSGFLALADGREAFAARLRLADAAERSIDLQTYIFHGDATGTLMIDRLRRAADRGVRVRLLLDDNNTAGLDPILAMLDAHPNVEVRLFNPFANRRSRLAGYATDFSRLNRRMHNKSFTVDNQATVVGGRNIGDEYFLAGQGTTFADLDVLAVGGVVGEVSSLFDRYWNSEPAYPAASILGDTAPVEATDFNAQVQRVRESAEAADYVRALFVAPQVQDLIAGRAQPEWSRAKLVFDDPEKVLHPPERRDLQLGPRLEATLGKAATSLDLVSPYFVPGADGALALQTTAQRGVRVRILTNSLAATDVSAVHAGYAKWRKDLLRAGVQLLELKPSAMAPSAGSAEAAKARGGPGGGSTGGSSKASLHAKTFGVDGQRIFVGSFNLDQRSARLNTEMGVVIDSPRFAADLGAALDRVAKDSAYVLRLSADDQIEWVDGDGTVYTHDPHTGAMRRGLVKVMSWLPIDWML
jgi:cardiolipin synthase C